MTPIRRRAVTVLTTALLGAAVLGLAAGCSAIGPDAGVSTGATSGSGGAGASTSTAPSGAATASAKTKAAACAVLDSKLDDITASMSSTAKKFAADPGAAVTSLNEVTSTLRGTIDELQDPHATTLVRTAMGDLDSLVTAVQNAADHPITGAPAVQKAFVAVQNDAKAITTYCS